MGKPTRPILWRNVCCIYIVTYCVLTPAFHVSQMGKILVLGDSRVLTRVPVPYDGCTGGWMTTLTRLAIDCLRPETRDVVMAAWNCDLTCGTEYSQARLPGLVAPLYKPLLAGLLSVLLCLIDLPGTSEFWAPSVFVTI